MVTFDEAVKIARKLKSNIDGGEETENAYIFGSQEDAMSIGGDGPIVIMKDTGKAINMTAYCISGTMKETIREFKL